MTAAMENAKNAVGKAGKNGFIALDIGPTGKLLKPLGDLGFEEAYGLFSDVVKIGAREGADLVLIETMSDSYEVKAAVLAAKENCDLPVFATMIFDSKGKLLTEEPWNPRWLCWRAWAWTLWESTVVWVRFR